MPRTSLRDATILFDLDGTLVDTAPDLINALNDALTRRGHTPIPQETIRGRVRREGDDRGSVAARRRRRGHR